MTNPEIETNTPVRTYVCKRCRRQMKLTEEGWENYIGGPREIEATAYLAQSIIDEPRRRFDYCCSRPTFHNSQINTQVLDHVGRFNDSYLTHIPEKLRLL